MPAIRDTSYAYEGTTTDAGLTVPICARSSSDLLISMIMGDTGAPVWTNPTGFKTLFSRNNTTSNRCAFKISDGTETDLVWGSSLTETYNGCVIAIRDVDPKTPFSTAIGTNHSYSESNQSATQALGNGTTTAVSQSFAGVARILATTTWYLSKTGSPTGNIVAKLYAHSGTFGTSSVPTGAALATSDTIAASSLTGSLTLTKFVFPNTANWYEMASGTNYTVVLEYSAGDVSNYVNVGVDTSAPTHGGNFATFAAAVWTAAAGTDACFYCRNFDYSETASAGAASETPNTVTVERDDSIVLFWKSGAVVALPSWLQGAVHHLTGGDGSAESMGIGWAWQEAAGTSDAAPRCIQYASGAGILATLAVNPPSTGATVFPPHIAADSCTLLEPFSNAAWNGNTALAATADTNFGTSLGGVTANDGTVGAIADVGINSYRSMGGNTSTAIAGQISGVELVFSVANRPNIGTKNVLAHVRPSTPAHAQRWSTVGSGRGCWFGLRSNTAGTSDHKVWQVAGSDQPWGKGAHVPIVVNDGAGNTKDTSGTLNTAAVTAMGFWAGSLAALTTQIGITMAWLMDTTILCGGVAAEPIDIAGIVNTIQSKERQSALLQGANQMLLLQDLQLGNGGTNPLYLELNGTAIEFPRQYNAATKEVNYNSVDNKIGLKYYAGASDTVTHRNSILSSRSRYFWGLHASSSTSATYDFSGTQVIGAGTITLARAITISGLTINDYSTIDASSLTLQNSEISNVPSANDSLTVNSSSSFSSCTLDVSGVAVGGRWVSTATPEDFSNCAFTGGGGHAMRLTATGTFAFVGNTFTSFGPAARTFNTGSGVDGGTDVVTTDAAHGYADGDPVYYEKHGGSQAIGLTDSTLYYVRAVSTTTLAFYASAANAIADSSRIGLTSAGSETHAVYSARAAIFNDVGAVVLNVSGGGDTPSYRNGAGAGKTTTVNNNVVLTISGFVTGSDVIVLSTGTETILQDEADIVGTSTTYSYPAASAGSSVDIGVFLAGYRPLYVRGVVLSASNATVPVAQTADRDYIP